jgi:Icc protein
MRLIQLSDCHLLADPNAKAYADIYPYQSLSAVLAYVQTLRPDAVIVSGDISGDDTPASYAHFIALMQRYLPQVDWRVIPGNHDGNPHFATHLTPYWLQAGDVWQLGQWCIHGLDTRATGTLGTIHSEQLKAISSNINTLAEMHHGVVLHHHPVALGSWMDKHSLDGVAILKQWLVDHPQLHFILHGHVHSEHADYLGNTPVLAVPSTCWQWSKSPDFGIADDAPGFRLLELTPTHWHSSIRRL